MQRFLNNEWDLYFAPYHFVQNDSVPSSFNILLNDGKQKTCNISKYTISFRARYNRLGLITKHLSDGDLYADWPELGYSIRLSEFTDG